MEGNTVEYLLKLFPDALKILVDKWNAFLN